MKKYVLTTILLIMLILTLFNTKWLSNKVADVLEKNPKVTILPANEYATNYDFEFVKSTTDFKPYGKKDLINIFYSIINNGWNVFTFYCPDEYTDCVNDVTAISEDEHLLSSINHYVHPFNNFTTLGTTFYENGEIIIEVKKVYSQENINKINFKIDQIISEIIKNDMELEDKLKTFHDYIINNTKYDVEKNETNNSPYQSNNAYGVLFEGFGICTGYTDTFAIFLHRLKIPNMKIASEAHIWNGLLINDKWLHIDLTWDDPVGPNKEDNLWHKYFLISNEDFAELDQDSTDHVFNKLVYTKFNY